MASVPGAQESDFLGPYNELLSLAAAELSGNFAAMASPTLSKQETVTYLYGEVWAQEASGKPPGFPWRALVEFVPRLVLSFFNLHCASLRFRVGQLPRDCIYFRTWLVPRSFRNGALVDDYFRGLPDELSSDHSVVVSFQPLDYSLLGSWGKARRKENHIVSVGLLGVADIFKLAFDYVANARVSLKRRYVYRGRDITAAINRSLLIDYLQLRSFQAYLEKYVCRRLLQFRLKAFVYVFENQSWEKVCCSILRQRSIRLIGYQSSGFSRVFLNFFPTERDSGSQPMPDVILTVGELFTRFLLQHGHFSVPVRTFAALRFPYPAADGRYAVRPPNPRLHTRVLYAFPVQVSQYAATLKSLAGVLADTPIAVDLQFHPIVKKRKLRVLGALPENFRIVERIDMNSLADTYDVVLFNDNSVGLESLLMGVRSYQYDPTAQFEDDRFFYFDLWDTRLDERGLAALRDQLIDGSFDKTYDGAAAAEYLNKMYGSYSGGSRSFLRLAEI